MVYDPGRPPYTLRQHWLNEPQVGVYAPCGVVSTRGTAVFVPSLLELQIYGRIYDPEMPAILSGWRWLYEPQAEIYTSCWSVSTPGTTVFVPDLWEL